IDSPGGQRFRRRLRPTQSELGEIDAAAIEEAKPRLTFVYETTPNSCLVEADEEPPHPPNPEALDIAVEIALLLDAKVASEVALALRSLLRATSKVMRGSGTIREDLKVSIKGGSRIEIKGVQELRLISTFVEKEVERQRMHREAAAELKRRGVRPIPAEVHNLSAAFKGTQSKVVATALKRGGVVLGWSL